MPFTGSHPAAVIPLMRGPLVPSALVIGSMVPDLPYYVPLPISFAFTHTIVGVVSIDLAMAVVCFAVWQGLLAPVVVSLSPEGLRARLGPELPAARGRFVAGAGAAALVAISIVIGALTHLLWDAFTHVDHWGPRHIAWLAERHGPLDGYRWAQYASGVFGAAVIAVSAWRWWRRTPADGAQRVPHLPSRVAWAAWSVVAAAILVGGVVGLARALGDDQSTSRALYHAATLGGGLGLLTALACAAWCARLLRRAAD